MIEELLLDINSILESIAIHGFNGIRKDNINELDKIILRLERIGMSNLHVAIKEFRDIIAVNRFSLEEDHELMEAITNKYFTICSMVFLMGA